uniref:DNA damage-inducible protein 1 n=1 Tax=Araucaria cunninghamii TaxID=56994 RepID=A0A0D6R3V1_ARACU
MKITVMTADERIISLDVDPQELVENVKALLEVETQIPLHQQQLLYHGRETRNTECLSALGVVDGDLLMMVSNNTRTVANDLGLTPDGSAVNGRALMQHLRNDSNLMSQLRQRDPEFAHAITADNLDAFQNILRQHHQEKLQLERQQQEQIALLNADPFDVEAQRKIEEMIREKNIHENWETALEHNPEAFARVVMLYVDMEVNGVPLKAFVDSGAQMTIISRSCAERCGLLRLLDKRYTGIARGVGQSAIVGRIHVAPIKIGTVFYPCTFTVLDSPDLEFIFGLDMLRKHQCEIDLKANVLRVGGGEVSVPFLQEKDIPGQFLDIERFANPGALASAELSSAKKAESSSTSARTSGPSQAGNTQGSDYEVKIAKLMELGFDRASVIQALNLFNGNEEQAAGFLFGG